MNARAPMTHPGYPVFRRAPRMPLARIQPPRTSGGMDDIKAFLDKEAIPGVKNKFTLGAVLIAGVLYYGHTQRWF